MLNYFLFFASSLRLVEQECLHTAAGIQFPRKPKACLLSKLKMKEWLQIKENNIRTLENEEETVIIVQLRKV